MVEAPVGVTAGVVDVAVGAGVFEVAGVVGVVDVLTNAILFFVLEAPSERQPVARGKLRYDRFLKSVGMAMVGDSQAAMAELLGRGHEN